MKCLVAIKQVIDPYFTIRVKADNTGVETNNAKMAINPFDEIAIEEAVRLKEQGLVQEIIVVSIGNKSVQETLRQALARGADQAILIETDQELMPLNVAKCLKVLVEQQQPQLVILGKQAIDNDCNQTGQMLAAMLGWAQGAFISKLTLCVEHIGGAEQAESSVNTAGTKHVDSVESISDRIAIAEKIPMAKIIRETDVGLECLTLKLPAVLTTDLRLNEPRYISLPNVMQAKRKPLVIKPISELGLNLTNTLKVLKVEAAPQRVQGKKLDNVQELVEILKTKGFKR